MGISWGGTIYPWKSAAVISSILIGGAMLVALFLWEGFMNLTYPAIPVKFFANRGFISLVACATVASVSVSKNNKYYQRQKASNDLTYVFPRCSIIPQCFFGPSKSSLCTRKTSRTPDGSR